MKRHILGLGITLAVAAGCSEPLQPRDAERPVFSQSILTGYSGAICTGPGSDCNQCVPNVQTAFNGMPGNFAPAAFHFGTTFRWMNDPSNLHHNEGIVRLAHAGGTHFAVSRYTGEGFAEVAFVNFASRAVFGGGRLYGNYTGDNRYYPTNDVAEGHVTNTLYAHAGGMQALGQVVAVGLEEATMGGIPTSKVVFVNAANPGSPGWISAEVTRDSTSGNVGMAKLGDGTYLLMVGNYNSRQLTFYQSTGTDIFNPGVFNTVATIANPYPQNWQSSQLVTQCDGALFVVASGTGGTIDGLLRVARIDPYLGYFTGVAYKTLQQSHAYGELGAGGGAYVAWDGKLYYYLVAPDNEIAELNHNNGVCPQNKTQGVAMFEY